MRRDLDRVIKYAEGLGIKVTFKPKTRKTPAAEWATDGSQITVYLYAQDTFTSIILMLIHELAHHMAFVYNNRSISQYIEEIFMKADQPGNTLTKKQRKVIYDEEVKDSAYQEIIYKELNLKLPKYKLLAERDASNWVYKKWYMSGLFPASQESRNKKKDLLYYYKNKEKK